MDAGGFEVPALAVVALEQLESREGALRRLRRAPGRCHVEAFSPEDAEHLGIGDRTEGRVVIVEVVLADRRLGSRVMLSHPLAHPRDQADLVVDPRRIRVGLVPERAGIFGRAAALRVVVQIEIVENATPRSAFVGFGLIEQPGRKLLSAVALSIGGILRAGALGHIGARAEVARPSPLHRTRDRARRIRVENGNGIVPHPLPELIVGQLSGMNVVMRRAPQRRLVVELVDASAVGRPVLADQVI